MGPSILATWSGVTESQRCSTETPWSRHNVAVATWPVEHAAVSGVVPQSLFRTGSAPCSRHRRASSTRPCSHAKLNRSCTPPSASFLSASSLSLSLADYDNLFVHRAMPRTDRRAPLVRARPAAPQRNRLVARRSAAQLSGVARGAPRGAARELRRQHCCSRLSAVSPRGVRSARREGVNRAKSRRRTHEGQRRAQKRARLRRDDHEATPCCSSPCDHCARPRTNHATPRRRSGHRDRRRGAAARARGRRRLHVERRHLFVRDAGGLRAEAEARAHARRRGPVRAAGAKSKRTA